jgi:membrane associated rhomboid family serine protease
MLPDISSDRSLADVKVYEAKSSSQWRLAVLFLAVGGLGFLPLARVLGWLSGGPRPDGGLFIVSCLLLLLPLGLLFASNALRGLPRLTVTTDGIRLENGIRTAFANWDSLGPFVVTPSRRYRTASARRVRARPFLIPDQFAVPINVIAAELNAVRAMVTGDVTSDLNESVPKEPPLGLAQFKIPWLTLTLLAVLLVTFALENIFPVTPAVGGLSPSIATLLAFGALSHKLILSSGEWYRLFTAPLLHANLAHILGNGLALVLGGWLLERLVGRLWFFGFFTIGALGGSLFSLAVNPVNLVSVGASGALMGLFAALFVSSFRFASGTATRAALQLNSLRILIPSLLPFLQISSIGRIDYGAHIGGALSGAVLALLLLRNWPESARIPQLRTAAALISAIGAILFVASSGLAIANYARIAHTLQGARPAAPSPPTDILSDHGPNRVACDAKWAQQQPHDPAAYRTFLQNCMKGRAGP